MEDQFGQYIDMADESDILGLDYEFKDYFAETKMPKWFSYLLRDPYGEHSSIPRMESSAES